MEWARILAPTTRSLNHELRLRNEYLLAENRVLKAQLNGRLRLSDAERATLGKIGYRLGRRALSEVATAAHPDTILAWHRRLAARKFDRSRARRAPGRPRIESKIEALIIRMAEENRSWGYDRIVGALANLGHDVSDQTVGNVLRRNGIPSAPERKRRTTWAEFIRMHLAVLAGTDISAVGLIVRQLVTYYVLLCIYLQINRIDFARISDCASNQAVKQMARSGREHCDLRDCGYLLHGRGASLAIDEAYSVKTLAPVPSPHASTDLENSIERPKNEPLSKVIPFGKRSSLRVTNGRTESNRQGKFAILLRRQTAETRCEEAARCRERLGETRYHYFQDAA